MTIKEREEALAIMNVIIHMIEKQYDNDRVEKAVDTAIAALKAEPCEDAVSRADTLQSFESYCEKNCQYSKKQRDVMCGACMMGDAIEIVENLPPVTPKQRTGHWVEIGDEPYDTWECDNCAFVIDGSGCVDPEEYRDIYKYCPNCGAKMGGESG